MIIDHGAWTEYRWALDEPDPDFPRPRSRWEATTRQPATLAGFYNLLATFDWYFEYADDHRTWAAFNPEALAHRQWAIEDPTWVPLYAAFIDYANGDRPMPSLADFIPPEVTP